MASFVKKMVLSFPVTMIFVADLAYQTNAFRVAAPGGLKGLERFHQRCRSSQLGPLNIRNALERSNAFGADSTLSRRQLQHAAAAGLASLWLPASASVAIAALPPPAIVVTGAASGIGRSSCHKFVRGP